MQNICSSIRFYLTFLRNKSRNFDESLNIIKIIFYAFIEMPDFSSFLLIAIRFFSLNYMEHYLPESINLRYQE